MIIDHTYFIGKLNLPQVGDTLGRQDITNFINDYEPEYLEKALGYELAQLFTNEVYSSGSGSLSDRIDKLLNGDEFTWENKLMKWPGFEKAPIQHYVYYHFMENRAIDTNNIGTTTAAAENAIRVAPELKMIAAWNDMVNYNEVLLKYLFKNRDVYPEFPFNDCQRPDIFYRKNQFGL